MTDDQHAAQAGDRGGPQGGLRHLRLPGERYHPGWFGAQDPRVPTHMPEIWPRQHREQQVGVRSSGRRDLP